MVKQKGVKPLCNMSITIVLGAIVMLLLFPSCGSRDKKLGEAITERDSLPVMATYGVRSFISDSGITRYRIDAEEWMIYDRKKPSYWAFEKGIHLEQFDTLGVVEASIDSDTAYYFDKDEMWKLMGNIRIKNNKGERFNTELLYWDQAQEKVYSDRFIRIEQKDRIIMGHGFTSNQQMTVYEISNIEGIIYVDEEAEQTTTPNDSIE